jgi:hypothetical protein
LLGLNNLAAGKETKATAAEMPAMMSLRLRALAFTPVRAFVPARACR